MTALDKIQQTTLADQLFSCWDCSDHITCSIYKQRHDRVCQQFKAPSSGHYTEIYQDAIAELNYKETDDILIDYVDRGTLYNKMMTSPNTLQSVIYDPEYKATYCDVCNSVKKHCKHVLDRTNQGPWCKHMLKYIRDLNRHAGVKYDQPQENITIS
jgi:hypothetical protein